MSDDAGSVTLWLGRLQAGDAEASRRLWERYYERLVRLANGRLPDRVRSAADGEDVAQSAFKSFFRAVERKRFPALADRGGLWAVLLTITERKRLALLDREGALKRGGDRRERLDIDVADAEPTPEFAAQVAEECERLLGMLRQREPMLERIALWKLEGHTDQEVAALAGRSVATVERKLKLIRSLWASEPSAE